MKVNVKGLVFVGFAAAILSGAAKAAGENIVTSKAYTDATYQTKINGGADEGKAVIAGANAGSPTYRAITNSGSSLNATSTSLVTEKAVAEALAAAAGGEGSSFEVTSNKLNGTSSGQKIGDLQAGSSAGQDQTMYPSAAAVKEYVTTTLASGGTSGNGYEEKANKVSSIASGEENNTTKYTSNAAVTGYAQAKAPSDNEAKVGYNGSWYKVDASGSYVTKGVDTDSRAITFSLTNIGTNGVAGGEGAGAWDSDIAADSTKLTTGKAVYEYVDDAINEAMTGTNGVSDTYQVKSTGTQVGGANGSWQTFTNGTYATLAQTGDATNGYTITVDVNALTDEGLANVNTTTGQVGTNDAKLPTARAVKAYVDTQDALDEKLTNKLDGTSGHTIGATTSGAQGNDTTMYPSAAAVKEYVSSQISAQPASKIPDQNTGVCTSSQPCALVAGATSFHWITMATGSHGGGVCGDAGTNQTCEGLGTAPAAPANPEPANNG